MNDQLPFRTLPAIRLLSMVAVPRTLTLPVLVAGACLCLVGCENASSDDVQLSSRDIVLSERCPGCTWEITDGMTTWESPAGVLFHHVCRPPAVYEAERKQRRSELRSELPARQKDIDRLTKELVEMRRQLKHQEETEYHERRRREIEAQGGSYWVPSAPLAPIGETE